MVLNVSFDIFSPDDWMVVVGLEEFVHIVCPRINIPETLPTENLRQKFLDSDYSGGTNVITEDAK